MTGVREGAGLELRSALESPAASARLHAALNAGIRPDPEHVEVLVRRCAVEPDFFVRDMLSWALTRHDVALTVERLLDELGSDVPQGRSQALHTLSKIGDARTWPAITTALLTDEDDEVARTAWRTAAGLVPEGRETGLAETLATQFDRGDGEVQRSLSRAFVALGAAVLPVVERAITARDAGVRTHALATKRLMQHPDEGFDAAIAEARRTVALRGAPLVEE
ncbi:HEAT repeat domain-containing protein [Pseudonocardia sp. RS11V-5]|uniref:HEAT repeat domain-containing protein n=1 Tax=Pseudonocardia terrae TaxID=2905831 RepID=UPI001E3F2F15|nr:HEAT repeat domain-containing protein [Pseudonocardia terrae]MCE3551688.1 HEAT repeat domain-containing protein [Pseudonocardia terrae]